MYRFLPTSLLHALIPGNGKVISQHLQKLYHWGLVNRFRLSVISEFVYYLDSRRAFDLLVEVGGMRREELDWKMLRTNREAKYYAATDPKTIHESLGRLVFLGHELMISRMHALLELGCRESSGQVELFDWRQGRSKLRGRVWVPKLFRRQGEWLERQGEYESLPHEPDAFFSLALPERRQKLHFFYEADRRRTASVRFSRKLRAHFAYVVHQKRHQEKYGVKRIRAILVETLDERWRDHLREAARHPIVSGGRASSLFWFAASTAFAPFGATTMALPKNRSVIFERLWLSPVDEKPRSLLDS